MKFNYLFKILSAFLVISGLYSCSVEEEDTNDEFSFTINNTNYSTQDYYLTNSDSGMYLVGRFGSDSMIFFLRATQDLPIIVGEYGFTGNNFYSAIHATDTSIAFNQLGFINFTEVSKRVNAEFSVWVDPIFDDSYLIENGVLKNLLVTHPVNNPNIIHSDPNAPFNIDYVSGLQIGISANINANAYFSPENTTFGTKIGNTIEVAGTDGNGNQIVITIYDATNTFVGKTYNAIGDIDMSDNRFSIHYETIDGQNFKSNSGKLYVKSIDEENKATIVFKTLLQDQDNPTNLFVLDEGAIKNILLVEVGTL